MTEPLYIWRCPECGEYERHGPIVGGRKWWCVPCDAVVGAERIEVVEASRPRVEGDDLVRAVIDVLPTCADGEREWVQAEAVIRAWPELANVMGVWSLMEASRVEGLVEALLHEREVADQLQHAAEDCWPWTATSHQPHFRKALDDYAQLRKNRAALSTFNQGRD